MIFYIVTFLIASFSVDTNSIEMVNQINKIRAEGCYCGDEYKKSVGPIRWNDTLYKSAMTHAKQMHKFNFFSHYSRDGKDVGQRLTAHGYPWQVVGENIAEGQVNFKQVLDDWIKSETHCKMLMDERVDEMGIARYKRFWVQHFGKQLPTDAIQNK